MMLPWLPLIVGAPAVILVFVVLDHWRYMARHPKDASDLMTKAKQDGHNVLTSGMFVNDRGYVEERVIALEQREGFPVQYLVGCDRTRPMARKGDKLTCANGHDMATFALTMFDGDCMQSCFFEPEPGVAFVSGEVFPECPRCGAEAVRNDGRQVHVCVNGEWVP